MIEAELRTCRLTTEAEALAAFAGFNGKTQSADHIRPLHWYVACRLVIEGGFHPDDVTPHPPFRVQRGTDAAPVLHYDATKADGKELTVLGGLKTKNVDVVVTRNHLGPVVAVSCKGVTGAFRNLTNRMEETIGECTNLHITYPALVLGYIVLLRANTSNASIRTAADALADENMALRALKANDIALAEGGEPIAGIVRFHNALRELSGRRGIRNDVSRYESIALAMVEMHGEHRLLNTFPGQGSPLEIGNFFNTLYLRYDERFVTSAPDLARTTRRLAWDPASPAFVDNPLGYRIRLSD